MPLPAEVDAAYLAGFIDGEGSLGVYPTRFSGITLYHQPRLSISNTNKDILEYIQEIWGGKIYTYKNHGWGKLIHRIQWQSQYDLVRILPRIIPYLIIKFDQAKEVLLWCQQRGNDRDRVDENLDLVESINSHNSAKGGFSYEPISS